MKITIVTVFLTLRFLITISIIYVLFTGIFIVGSGLFSLLSSLFSPGVVVEEHLCYIVSNLQPPSPCISSQKGEDYSTAQIEVILSKDNGCDHQTSDNGTLHISTPVLDLDIERLNSEIKVNNIILKPGEEFHFINIIDINPWKAYELRLRNDNCISTPTYQKIVAVGSYGSEYFFTKGLIILSALIGVRIIFRHYWDNWLA